MTILLSTKLRIKPLSALFFLGQVLFAVGLSFAEVSPRYEIRAELDTKNHRIRGGEKVSFTNNSDRAINEVYFHIYPHRKYSDKEISFSYQYSGYFKTDLFPEGFQSGDLKIISARNANGRPLTYKIEGEDQTILKVNLEEPLLAGRTIELELDFDLDIPHCWNRLGWHRNIITLTRWYPILSVLDKKGWHNHPFYIYHQPFFSDSAYYRLEIKLPTGEYVACGAALRSEEINPDGTKTLVLENESPMRDFGLAVSPDFRVYSQSAGKVKINVFYLEGDRKYAVKMAGYAAAAIDFYGRRFGEYPYPEFNVAPSYLGFGGDQSSGMIFIDIRMYRLPGFLCRYSDFLVSHETGHQWFYNIVGSDEYREMFMDEGMNSFWLLRHLEEKYGYGARVLDLPKPWRWLIPNFSFRDSTAARYIYLAKNGYDRPVIGELSSFKEPSSIFALTYGKGAAFLGMLEARLGKDVFEKAIARYSREFRFRNAGLEDLIRICEEESGRELKGFFDQWLKTAKTCDFAVREVRPGKAMLENRGSIQMPVDTRVVYRDGSETIDHWDGQSKTHEIVLEKDKPVRNIAVDPDRVIDLDLDRTNNHWPRNFKLTPVPLYFFPWELPLLSDRDAYNAFVGPSVGGSSLGLAGSAQKPYDQLLRLSTVYDFNAKSRDSLLGYEVGHVLGVQNRLGFEVFDYESSKAGNDLSGGKVYLRRELWPASYGIFDVNDHVTLYLLRNRKLDSLASLNGLESVTNMKYTRKDEAIIGITGSLARCGPSFDPECGWKFQPTIENAGHFLGGNQSFWRCSAELDNYYSLFPRYRQKLASRIKAGTGKSADKKLFQLGGWEGLRGYDLKTVDGSRMMLASLEYRVPLAEDLRMHFLDNIFCLDQIQGVVFFDVGKAWYSDYSGVKFRKDAGLGLRFHLGTIGILERTVLRVDVARAIDAPKEDTHVWFGINQSF